MESIGNAESFDSSITPTCFPPTCSAPQPPAEDQWQATRTASGEDSEMLIR